VLFFVNVYISSKINGQLQKRKKKADERVTTCPYNFLNFFNLRGGTLDTAATTGLYMPLSTKIWPRHSSGD
jgi:hypothetical protein